MLEFSDLQGPLAALMQQVLQEMSLPMENGLGESES
jgi:hypothetical protein